MKFLPPVVTHMIPRHEAKDMNHAKRVKNLYRVWPLPTLLLSELGGRLRSIRNKVSKYNKNEKSFAPFILKKKKKKRIKVQLWYTTILKTEKNTIKLHYLSLEKLKTQKN
jgi:hypothetical protein